MAVLNRNITRTILNGVEETSKTADIDGVTLPFVIDTPDAFYVGFNDRFSARYFDLGTVNTNSVTLDVKYYDGTDFSNSVDDIVDQTAGFTKSGFISWQNKTDWEKTDLAGIDSDIELFWVKIEVSGALSAGTTLNVVLNLFSDDQLIKEYYPHLISDTRFLPQGETNFLKQHLAVKNFIVLKLKQKRWIKKEGDIIDINAVSVAAAHAFSYMIWNPIAFDDESRNAARSAFEEFTRELRQVSLNIDLDQDGVVDEDEREEVIGTSRIVRA